MYCTFKFSAGRARHADMAALEPQTWTTGKLNKMQIVFRSWQKRAAMIVSGIEPQFFVESTCILGIDFESQHEVLPATAQKRVENAWKRIPCLMILRASLFLRAPVPNLDAVLRSHDVFGSMVTLVIFSRNAPQISKPFFMHRECAPVASCCAPSR